MSSDVTLGGTVPTMASQTMPSEISPAKASRMELTVRALLTLMPGCSFCVTVNPLML